MSQTYSSNALPIPTDGGPEYLADIWQVPWKQFDFDYCGVYLIAPEGKWPVKIGISEDVQKRLGTLQTGHWYELKVVNYWICQNKAEARRVELKAHLDLQPRRMRGEWFDIRPTGAADVVEWAGETQGIQLAKAIPETARFAPIRAQLEEFYQAKYKRLVEKSGG